MAPLLLDQVEFIDGSALVKCWVSEHDSELVLHDHLKDRLGANNLIHGSGQVNTLIAIVGDESFPGLTLVSLLICVNPESQFFN